MLRLRYRLTSECDLFYIVSSTFHFATMALLLNVLGVYARYSSRFSLLLTEETEIELIFERIKYLNFYLSLYLNLNFVIFKV